MKLLIASSIDPNALETLRERHDVLCMFGAKEEALKSAIDDREVLIFRSGVNISAEVMTCAPNLKLVIRAGSGMDNIDVNYLEEHKITFTRIPEPGAQAVAELTFTVMLAMARNLLEADRLTRQGRWAKNELSGYLLTGKVLGIIGAGNIGSRVGQMGAAWGMTSIGCVDSPSPQVAAKLRERGIRLTDCAEVITTADFLSIHVPLQDSTRNMINEAVLARMKPGSFLINMARGGVVDEEALYRALTEGGRLRGAALDVHKQEGEGKISPLANLSNVILTPHIGAQTVDSQLQIGQRIIEILDSFLATRCVVEEPDIVLA